MDNEQSNINLSMSLNQLDVPKYLDEHTCSKISTFAGFDFKHVAVLAMLYLLTILYMVIF